MQKVAALGLAPRAAIDTETAIPGTNPRMAV
jgi:hypothetical protein